MKSLAFLLAGSLFFSSTLHADMFVELSAAAIDFDYTEFDRTGDILDRETGRLNGKTVLLGFRGEHVEHSLRHTTYDGEVDYNGITGGASPQPLVTNTDTDFRKTAYRQFWTELREEYRTSIYLDLAYNDWDRDIQPTTAPVASSGLTESYTWWTAEVGVNFDIARTTHHALEFGYGVFSTFDSKISVLQKGNASLGLNDDVISFELGDSRGTHITLTYKYRIDTRYIIEVALENTQWDFGSNTVTVRRLPTSFTSTITEPDSESDHNTLRAGLVIFF